MITLFDPIDSFPLIGPSIAQKLNKLQIFSIEDLLHHYPLRYLDRIDTTPIAQLTPDTSTTIIGQVIDFKNIRTRFGKNIQQAVVSDETGHITLTWFNQTFLSRALSVGQTYAFSGKTKLFQNKITLTAPDFEQTEPGVTTLHTGRLVPVYPETAGISSKRLRSRIFHAFEFLEFPDHLPSNYLIDYNLIPLKQALYQIHFPNTAEEVNQAKTRLAFDELFLLQLNGALKRHQWTKTKSTKQINLTSTQLKAFTQNLKFKLTNSQTKAISQILSDLSSTTPMNRLVEGDVGSGKTVVAAAAIYASHLSGYRSIVMAPTEILANQLFESLTSFLSPFNLSLSLFTGSTKQTTSADILIGTHALLYNLEKQQNIGLIVIDEQHRFGVEQRATLENISGYPHRLTMSATPIPRTVALTLYGDLDITIIDELPKNRKPVKTWVVPHEKRAKAYSWIKDQINSNQTQAFVVCPLIDPSQSLKLTEVKSATQEFEQLTKIFSTYNLALLHGKIKPKQKDQIITNFKLGQQHILVTTPVIEVGIDIPNASIIVIEAAERFGLAQLHQLRGRVGRGDQQSYCLLFSTTQNKTENQRLKAMTKYNSGFKLAEIDLKLRGPGDVFGSHQHGFDQLKIARLSNHKLLQITKQAALSLVKKDPNFHKYPLLKAKLTHLNFPQNTTAN